MDKRDDNEADLVPREGAPDRKDDFLENEKKRGEKYGGAGALGGAVAGVAVGAAVGGPVGAVVGGVIGVTAGGMAGAVAEEVVDPVLEEEWWRASFETRPYAGGQSFEHYRSAYVFGWDAHRRYPGRHWEEIEDSLEQEWLSRNETLTWNDARQAARDAWDRIERRKVGATENPTLH